METVVRPLAEADVAAAVIVQRDSFDDRDRLDGLVPDPFDDARRERMQLRLRHFITNDPSGSWVATVDDHVAGVALALRRDGMWGLSLLVVDPRMQSAGLGRQLINATLTYAEGCDRAVILASTDPRAMRTYATSGFDLFPQVHGDGEPDRTALPALGTRVREGSVVDAEWADAIDLAVRGARRGPDHVRLATDMTMYVVDDVDGQGYAYVHRGGHIMTTAATDDDTATALLWRCLAHAADEGAKAGIHHITAEQQWAIRTAYRARLLLKPDGPVFYRGMTPPPCYLPSGAYL